MSDPFHPTYCRRCRQATDDLDTNGHCQPCAQVVHLEVQLRDAEARAAQWQQHAQQAAAPGHPTHAVASPTHPVSTTRIASGVFCGIAACVVAPIVILALLAAIGYMIMLRPGP